MPFNRNPKWFGLTQAQERKKGIDAVLGLGGRLLLFQFKAQTDSRIKIERDQLTKLASVESSYPGSTYYVFPEAEDIYVAARPDCMFTETWCCTPSALNKKISCAAKSASFAIDTKKSELSQARPKKTVKIERACKQFGCFCLSLMHEVLDEQHDLTDSTFAAKGNGIPIGIDLPRSSMEGGGDADAKVITSTEMFEKLLGEGAHQNLGPGLRALFIAQ